MSNHLADAGYRHTPAGWTGPGLSGPSPDDALEEVLETLYWADRSASSVSVVLDAVEATYSSYLLFQLSLGRDALDDEARQLAFDRYRDWLEGDDNRLQELALYDLWSMWFEGSPRDQADAARGVLAGLVVARGGRPSLAAGQGARQRVRLLTRMTGPLSWEFKAPLFEVLAAGSDDEHQLLLSGLRAGYGDYYGVIEPTEALRLLRKARALRDDADAQQLAVLLADGHVSHRAEPRAADAAREPSGLARGRRLLGGG